MVTATKDIIALFNSGKSFDQIYFLDNFYQNVVIEKEKEQDLLKILQSSFQVSNIYLKRGAFKILCDLTMSKIITNPYIVLAELQTFLTSNEVDLQVIALKYLPHFPEMRTSVIEEKIKELSDDSNGEVASQAYFCYGLFQLTEAVSSKNTEKVITILITAKASFQAAINSVENRTDAEFYLLLINILELILCENVDLIESKFQQVVNCLNTRQLYEFDEQYLELDYLIFKLTKQIHQSFKTSNSAKTWLEVRPPIQALLKASQALRGVKEMTTKNQFLVDRFFINVFETIESSIYEIYLTNEKAKLEALKALEAESSIGQFLSQLISKLPETEAIDEKNNGLLALLSEIEGSEKGLKFYDSITNKRVSPEIIATLGNLARKYKAQPSPYRTGSIHGQEVFNALESQISSIIHNYPSDKLEAFLKIVEEVIRYARVTFVNSDRGRFPFLYAKANNFKEGKGQGATEHDLQNSMLQFLEHSKIMDGLEHEKARFVDGGRVDIVYKKDLITVPIELKKTSRRVNKEILEQNYIAQAQTYTSGYDQLGIFVLLDLSEKSHEPSPNFKDWFNIHHLPPSTNLPIKFPDYIVSIVIPGNKTSPSDKSKYG